MNCKLSSDSQQGDGTAFIFKDEPGVFTFSIHGEKNFPLHKQRSDLDVSLPDGTEDRQYLSTGKKAFLQLAGRYDVIYQV